MEEYYSIVLHMPSTKKPPAMPYMQTKLSQTTFMRSLAYSVPSDSNVRVASFWTNYPLKTDAILKRGIGSEADCMHPRILARTVEEMLFGNHLAANGAQVIDKSFLEARNINLTEFQMDKTHKRRISTSYSGT